MSEKSAHSPPDEIPTRTSGIPAHRTFDYTKRAGTPRVSSNKHFRHSSTSTVVKHMHVLRNCVCTAWCCEIGSLTSLDVCHSGVLSDASEQFHCTRLCVRACVCVRVCACVCVRVCVCQSKMKDKADDMKGKSAHSFSMGCVCMPICPHPPPPPPPPLSLSLFH